MRDAERGRERGVDTVRDPGERPGGAHDLLGERADHRAAEDPVPDRQVVDVAPSSATTPANSLPGTNGGGTLIWYSPATSSTSGKFTAAGVDVDEHLARPGGGEVDAPTVTTSGAPYSRQTRGAHLIGPARPARAFHERDAPFLGVLAAEDRGLELARAWPTGVEVGDAEGASSFVARTRERAVGGDPVGVGERDTNTRRPATTAFTQAEGRGAPRRDRLAGERELEGDAQRQPVRDEHAATAGNEAAPHLGDAELRARRRRR